MKQKDCNHFGNSGAGYSRMKYRSQPKNEILSRTIINRIKSFNA